MVDVRTKSNVLYLSCTTNVVYVRTKSNVLYLSCTTNVVYVRTKSNVLYELYNECGLHKSYNKCNRAVVIFFVFLMSQLMPDN